jgi:hypothetical protein
MKTTTGNDMKTTTGNDMKTKLKDLYQTVRTMIKELNFSISEDREEEIHAFYVRYSNMDNKYLLENCVTCPTFDDPPLYAFNDAVITLGIAYQRFEANNQ